MQRDVSKVSSNTDLLAELEKIASDKGFVISDNEGSGNCMFYALSEQLTLVKGIKILDGELRRFIVQYLRKNPKLVSVVFVWSCIFWLEGPVASWLVRSSPGTLCCVLGQDT